MSVPPSEVGQERADRFRRDIAALPGRASNRERMVIATGLAGMGGGLVVVVVAYAMAHTTTDALAQRDAITLALLGVALCVVGAALFLGGLLERLGGSVAG